ncbi:MAG: hypothetical protein ACYTXT_00390 [Nostoc sp.]
MGAFNKIESEIEIPNLPKILIYTGYSQEQPLNLRFVQSQALRTRGGSCGGLS